MAEPAATGLGEAPESEGGDTLGGSDTDATADVEGRADLALAPIAQHERLTQLVGTELGWPSHLHLASIRNTSTKKLTAALLPQQLRQQIEEANPRDRELYDFVAQLDSPLLNSVADLREAG